MIQIQPHSWINERYEIVREVGGGDSAIVFEARDVPFGRTVAIKFFQPNYFEALNGRERLAREYRSIGDKVAPFLPTYFDHGEYKGHPWLAMSFIRGKSLRDRFKSGPIEFAELLRILQSVAWALDTLHGNLLEPSGAEPQVIHRDVSPANIICTPDDPRNAAVLIDFGISRAVGDVPITEHGSLYGTRPYLAPEAYSEGVDARGIYADQFSLAVIAWEGIMGKPSSGDRATLPIDIGLAGRTAYEFEEAYCGGENLGILVFGVLAKALRRTPSERFNSCREFVEALDSAAFGDETILLSMEGFAVYRSRNGEHEQEGTQGQSAKNLRETKKLTALVQAGGDVIRPSYLPTELLGGHEGGHLGDPAEDGRLSAPPDCTPSEAQPDAEVGFVQRQPDPEPGPTPQPTLEHELAPRPEPRPDLQPSRELEPEPAPGPAEKHEPEPAPGPAQKQEPESPPGAPEWEKSAVADAGDGDGSSSTPLGAGLIKEYPRGESQDTSLSLSERVRAIASRYRREGYFE